MTPVATDQLAQHKDVRSLGPAGSSGGAEQEWMVCVVALIALGWAAGSGAAEASRTTVAGPERQLPAEHDP